MSNPLGKHLLIDFYDCDRSRLDDESFLRTEAELAARAMRATVVAVHSHRFSPIGVSVIVVLAESHLAVHTWPEHRTASADIFVCGDQTDPQKAKRHLIDALGAGHAAELELERGILDRCQSRRWRSIEPGTMRREDHPS